MLLASSASAQRTISQAATDLTDLELEIVDWDSNPTDKPGVDLFGSNMTPLEGVRRSVGSYLYSDVGRKVTIQFVERDPIMAPLQLELEDARSVHLMISVNPTTGQIKDIRQTVSKYKPGKSHFKAGRGRFDPAGSSAGPPANDLCAGAIAIGDGVTAFDTTGAGTDGPLHASCEFDGQTYNDIWYVYTATCDGDLTVSTCSDAGYDTDLVAYDGSDCGDLEDPPLACDDDTAGCAGFTTELEFPVSSGNEYLIRVGGFNAPDFGPGNLTITCTPSVGPPANDLCENSELIECGDTVMGDNTNATDSVDDPDFTCSGGGVQSLWYRFVATDTDAEISASGADPVLALYSGTCGNFVEICCDDDSGPGLDPLICCEGLTIGETYWIQLSSWSAGSAGPMTLTVNCPCPVILGRCCLDGGNTCLDIEEDDCLAQGGTWDEGLDCTNDPCPVQPDNDDCADAEALGGLPQVRTWDNTAATTDDNESCGSAGAPNAKNVWYSVIGTGNVLTASTCSDNTIVSDTKIHVFCNDCDTLPCVAGDDDSCTPPPGQTFHSTVSWCSQNTAEYLISVGNFSEATTPGIVELTVSDTGVPCEAEVNCLPLGACCILDGACATCVVLTEVDCNAAGGIYQGDDTLCGANNVGDPGFELFSPNPVWTEASTNFGTPLCTLGFCGPGGGTPPFEGDVWAWFGGIAAFEAGSVEQAVVIPVGANTLSFYYQHSASSGNDDDFLRVLVDGAPQVSFGAGDLFDPASWTQINVDISGFADGGAHLLRFESEITGLDPFNNPATTNFFVDLVEINSNLDVCDASKVTLDFTNEDDGVTALSDGQDLSTPPEFGVLFDISSAGDNQGAAIFDSASGGPNDPGLGVDPDLIVDQGNIVILQDNDSAFQTNAGFFDVPNDAQFGGTITFDFNQPTICEAIDLIDIENLPPEDQTATVTLTDNNGNERVYTAPDGWTEDFPTEGGTGVRTLDLTTLAPQPGFAAVATATEDAGFDPCNVVSLEVNFAGSAALDNLCISVQ